MTPPTKPRDARILVVDDDVHVVDAYRRVLDPLAATDLPQATGLSALALELFGYGATAAGASAPPPLAEVVYHRQGRPAVESVRAATREGRPFAVVFLDMRMPPGLDGLETAKRIRALDPYVNIVIATAYADHRPLDIAAEVGPLARLFYLVKPLNAEEVRHLAVVLADRWAAELDLVDQLHGRADQLQILASALVDGAADPRPSGGQDPLTGLPNRAGLAAIFAAPKHRRRREPGLLFLNVDRLQEVRDTLGHAAGERLLQAFAARLCEAVGERGVAARVGGDEFAVACADSGRIDQLAQAVLEMTREPFDLGNRAVKCTTSIGIAEPLDGNLGFDELLRRADIAFCAARACGRSAVQRFEHALDRQVRAEHELGDALAVAIENHELHLRYQPQVSVDGRRITGLEALVRWRHPARGEISPERFIAIAERENLIHELGAWVVRRAFIDGAAWPDIPTAVNLSPSQLRAPAFIDQILELAAEHRIDCRKFEFELTENILIEDIAMVGEQLRRLKAAGFQTALDDFGTGYSGICALKKLSFDKLKIDRSFVEHIADDEAARAVMHSLVDLGRALDLAVTAEGVETEAQRQLLDVAGCSQLQGYLFHRPLPKRDVCDLLAGRRGPPERPPARAASTAGIVTDTALLR